MSAVSLNTTGTRGPEFSLWVISGHWRMSASLVCWRPRVDVSVAGAAPLPGTYGVFPHVPSPGVPGGPQRPKIGQTQILSRRELSLLSCPTLELIEFGSRNAATKNNAPETSSKKYLAQPSINLTLTLDRLISDAAIDQTIIGSTAPKTNISREYLTAWVICIATSGT